MNEVQIIELKNKALAYLHKQEHKGAILEKIYKDLNLRPFPITALRSYLDEISTKGYITKTSISGSRIIYRITEKGRDFILNGGYSKPSITKSIPDKSEVSEKEGADQSSPNKKILFISYASENNDKIRLIKNVLEDHPLFEPLVIADRRRPNEALPKLIKEGIDSSYRIIPILSPQSFKEQWINQEIGYAEGKGIRIIPLIESSIFDKLKGFVNKQNQCPYLYTSRQGLHLRDENKEFKARFKLLVSDLETEINAYKNENKEIIKRANKSISGGRWYF